MSDDNNTYKEITGRLFMVTKRDVRGERFIVISMTALLSRVYVNRAERRFKKL